MLRTHTCDEINGLESGHQVILAGWLHSVQGQRPLVIQLRDRSGIAKVVFEDPVITKEVRELYIESVIQVTGFVRVIHSLSAENESAGRDVEVSATEFQVLNPSVPFPSSITSDEGMDEHEEQEYRFLALRNPRFKKNLEAVANVRRIIRDYLDKQGFIEVYLPRDYQNDYNYGIQLDDSYLTPSRLSLAPLLGTALTKMERCYQFVRSPINSNIPLPFGIEGTSLHLGVANCESIKDVFRLMVELIAELARVYECNVRQIPIIPDTDSRNLHERESRSGTDRNVLNFAWLADEHLFEKSEDGWRTRYHFFVSPLRSDLNLLPENPDQVRGESYALMCNNSQHLGLAYVRNSDLTIQRLIFRLLDLSEVEISKLAPVMSDAFEYNVHLCGMELQIEKLAAVFVQEDDITKMFPFP